MRDSQNRPRVAIVCDWMLGGGAEQVVAELANMFPEAPIYTSVASREWRERLDDRIVTGWLNRGPFPAIRKFVPFLRIWWFTRLRLDGYDLVISSSGAEAKGIRVPKGTLHINYCHAPTHYYWRRYDEYLRAPGFGIFNPLARLGLRALVGPLRRWDYHAAQRPDHMIANSTYTQKMIKKYYGRASTVIFPPVDVTKFKVKSSKLKEKQPSTFNLQPSTKTRSGFIVVGRQTPYKRIDLAVAACTKLKLPLTVIGDGPEHKRLVRMAGPTVVFLKNTSEEEKIKLLQTHAGFIFPNEDDFGISPVEAMAAGCPVIALRAGGALDTVKSGISGTFFDEPTVEALVSMLRTFRADKYSPAQVSNHAGKFSSEEFRDHLQKLVNSFI